MCALHRPPSPQTTIIKIISCISRTNPQQMKQQIHAQQIPGAPQQPNASLSALAGPLGAFAGPMGGIGIGGGGGGIGVLSAHGGHPGGSHPGVSGAGSLLKAPGQQDNMQHHHRDELKMGSVHGIGPGGGGVGPGGPPVGGPGGPSSADDRLVSRFYLL